MPQLQQMAQAIKGLQGAGQNPMQALSMMFQGNPEAQAALQGGDLTPMLQKKCAEMGIDFNQAYQMVAQSFQ